MAKVIAEVVSRGSDLSTVTFDLEINPLDVGTASGDLFQGTLNPAPAKTGEEDVEVTSNVGRTLSRDNMHDAICDDIVKAIGRAAGEGTPSKLSDGTSTFATANSYKWNLDASDILLVGFGGKGATGGKGDKGDNDPSTTMWAGNPRKLSRVPRDNNSSPASPTGRVILTNTAQTIRLANLTQTSIIGRLKFKEAPNTTHWGYYLYIFDLDVDDDYRKTTALHAIAIDQSSDTGKTLKTSSTLVSTVTAVSGVATAMASDNNRVSFVIGAVRKTNSATINNGGRLIRAVLELN